MIPARVRIFYPADPLGVVPGGIDTFIRGIIKSSPEELAFSLVGMTTDPRARPVGRWSRSTLGDREFDFFPVVHVPDAGRKGRVPLSARFTLAAARSRSELTRDFDIFDFHRLEPGLLFLGDPRPKNAFFHQDPSVVRHTQSDILWRKLPAAYESIESRLMPRLASAWCVRDSGVATLRTRYPRSADAVRFISTWVDTDVFHPVADAERLRLREETAIEHDIDPKALRITSVGRLDAQKDPLKLVNAFHALVRGGERVALTFIGDGALRPAVEQRVAALGLQAHVRFLGLRSAAQIADVLRSSDALALSSAYEGMPMAVLEALACGVPVAATDVGEVRRVVKPGVNGAIAVDSSLDAFSDCLADVLARRQVYRGAPCVTAIEAYQPAKVLEPVYAKYLELADHGRRVTRFHAGTRRSPVRPVPRVAPRSAGDESDPPVLTLQPSQARALMLEWAEMRDSRHVCFCDVDSAVLAGHDVRHRETIERADLVAHDSAPVAWTMRSTRTARRTRLEAAETMYALCAEAQANDIRVGLYGSTPATLRALRASLLRAFPGLMLAYHEAPPMRQLTAQQDRAMCTAIEATGIGLLFVALGTARQERWMSSHRGRIRAVMLGVGIDAFEQRAGLPRQTSGRQRAGFMWQHGLAVPVARPQRSATRSRLLMQGAVSLAGAATRGVMSAPLRAQSMLRTIAAPGNIAPAAVDEHHMADLRLRVDALLPSIRTIQFMASGPGEGTSTLARGYALAAAQVPGRHVLLLTAQSSDADTLGVLPTLAQGGLLQSALTRQSDGIWLGSLFGHELVDAEYGLLSHDDAWGQLRHAFDEIVLDMPSSAESRLGLLTSTRSDGVVVVLEAEKTRAPVIGALIDSLQAVRANVLGTVLNKRQFHVPSALYRRL